jgi:hypothetical protein
MRRGLGEALARGALGVRSRPRQSSGGHAAADGWLWYWRRREGEICEQPHSLWGIARSICIYIIMPCLA